MLTNPTLSDLKNLMAQLHLQGQFQIFRRIFTDLSPTDLSAEGGFLQITCYLCYNGQEFEKSVRILRRRTSSVIFIRVNLWEKDK